MALAAGTERLCPGLNLGTALSAAGTALPQAVGVCGSRLTRGEGRGGALGDAKGTVLRSECTPSKGFGLKISRPNSGENVGCCRASLTPGAGDSSPGQPGGSPGQPEFSGSAGSWFDFDSSLASPVAPPPAGPRDSDRGSRHSDRGAGNSDRGGPDSASNGSYNDTDSEHTGISSRGEPGCGGGEGGGGGHGTPASTTEGQGRASGEGRRGGGGDERGGSRTPTPRAPRGRGSGRGSGEGALPPRDLARVAGALAALGAGPLAGAPRAVHFSGCINESYTLVCERGKFFVKVNRSFSASEMFDGEAAILQAIHSTGAVKVPVPLTAGDLEGGGSFLVLEHLAFRPFAMLDAGNQAALGEALAELHLCTAMGTDAAALPAANSDGTPPADSADARQVEGARVAAGSSLTSALGRSFGFGCVTRLGVVPLNNSLAPSWSAFFVEQRLEDRFRRALAYLAQVGPPENELQELSGAVTSRSRALLEEAEARTGIRPSLLHGDLWLGNCGLVTGLNVPAMFDPAGFYGHAEFDLAFRGWEPQQGFPGFGDHFYEAYHSVLPKEPGFEERAAVYQLFHLLNHLVIYGWEYYSPCVKKCKQILCLA